MGKWDGWIEWWLKENQRVICEWYQMMSYAVVCYDVFEQERPSSQVREMGNGGYFKEPLQKDIDEHSFERKEK